VQEELEIFNILPTSHTEHAHVQGSK